MVGTGEDAYRTGDSSTDGVDLISVHRDQSPPDDRQSHIDTRRLPAALSATISRGLLGSETPPPGRVDAQAPGLSRPHRRAPRATGGAIRRPTCRAAGHTGDLRPGHNHRTFGGVDRAARRDRCGPEPSSETWRKNALASASRQRAGQQSSPAARLEAVDEVLLHAYWPGAPHRRRRRKLIDAGGQRARELARLAMSPVNAANVVIQHSADSWIGHAAASTYGSAADGSAA